MNLMQFEDDVDRYGGDLARWPPDRRDAARDLIASTPAARALFEGMQRLEAALRGASHSNEGRAHDRLAATATRFRQTGPRRRVVARAAWTTTAAAALVFGLVVGQLLPDRTTDVASLMSATFAPPESGDVD